MKNFKLSKKLLLSFGIVLILTIIVGLTGIFALLSMDSAMDDLYNAATPMSELAEAMEDFMRARFYGMEIIVFSGDFDRLDELEQDLHDAIDRFLYNMEYYQTYITTEEQAVLWNDIMREYNNIINPGLLAALGGARWGRGSLDLVNEKRATLAAADRVSDNLHELFEIRENSLSATNEDGQAVRSTQTVIIISVLVVSVIIGLLFAVYISGSISKPLATISEFMRVAANTGAIRFHTKDELEVVEKYGQNKDEIGKLVSNTSSFLNELSREMEMLTQISNGDLNIVPNILSEKDVVGHALTKVVNYLNGIISEVNTASEQVTMGSKQISDGAQALSRSSAEQSAATDELSASLTEITDKIKNNADMAGKAAELAMTIRKSAEKGSSQMDDMVLAVNEIHRSSQSISKVIKVIDDIAFQTNILALNAAVEAARAGQHGKGFAVVAEEVRTLASKSAEAARDTGTLISNSMEKAEQGARIASDTAESLAGIVTGINESTEIISEIAIASDMQSVGIAQINNGIDQVARTVQQNSATAEQSAAASEELSAQSAMLERMVARFRLRRATDRDKNAVSVPPDGIERRKRR